MAGFVYAWGMQEQETPTTVPDLKQVVLRLADPQERPEWACGAVDVRYPAAELRSLRAQVEAVEDSRSCHGRRHRLAVVLALQLLARPGGSAGGRQKRMRRH